MPAGIRHFQLIVLGKFLARLYGQGQRLATLVQPSAATFVQREFRVNQLSLMAGEITGTIEGSSGFFTAGQRHFDGTTVLEAHWLGADLRCPPRPLLAPSRRSVPRP